MKRLALAAVLLGLSAPAFAANTLTVTMVSDGNYVGTLSKTIVLTQADMNLFQSWMLANYQCSPQPACLPTTMPVSALAWITGFRDGLTGQVKAWQSATAAAAALAGVTPINPN